MKKEPKLTIFKNKSVLEKAGASAEVFEEGESSDAAKERTKKIKAALADGFLKKLIEQELKSPTIDFQIEDEQAKILKDLVESVTSEVGRALIGITTMQLCIKAIAPEQNVRLHKGGKGEFSWKEGISMRTLDKNYITPVLRNFDLLRLNADGFMMTRSLAENYPYTELYKAALKGGKAEWLRIVEALEENKLNALGALQYLVCLLINRSNKFQELSKNCILQLKVFLESKDASKRIPELINVFFESSEYSARAFEIAIHAAYQALEEMELFNGFLKPLSQMRSANKKHGNIGDIELLETSVGTVIMEAWDAKHGKSNLREELEELSEKLAIHPECKIAGFITNERPIRSKEISSRLEDIEGLHNCIVKIYSYREWFHEELLPQVGGDEREFLQRWLVAMTESLCQMRREKAPIDEPCEHWIQLLLELLTKST